MTHLKDLGVCLRSGILKHACFVNLNGSADYFIG